MFDTFGLHMIAVDRLYASGFLSPENIKLHFDTSLLFDAYDYDIIVDSWYTRFNLKLNAK